MGSLPWRWQPRPPAHLRLLDPHSWSPDPIWGPLMPTCRGHLRFTVFLPWALVLITHRLQVQPRDERKGCPQSPPLMSCAGSIVEVLVLCGPMQWSVHGRRGWSPYGGRISKTLPCTELSLGLGARWCVCSGLSQKRPLGPGSPSLKGREGGGSSRRQGLAGWERSGVSQFSFTSTLLWGACPRPSSPAHGHRHTVCMPGPCHGSQDTATERNKPVRCDTQRGVTCYQLGALALLLATPPPTGTMLTGCPEPRCPQGAGHP